MTGRGRAEQSRQIAKEVESFRSWSVLGRRQEREKSKGPPSLEKEGRTRLVQKRTESGIGDLERAATNAREMWGWYLVCRSPSSSSRLCFVGVSVSRVSVSGRGVGLVCGPGRR